MATESNKANTNDTVIRLTIKQGTEKERFGYKIDNIGDAIEKNNQRIFSTKDLENYKYFPSGELIYTRDTCRVFVGNNTNTFKSVDGDITVETQQEITEGGTLVGNKYLGLTSDSPYTSQSKHSKLSIYNEKYDAYDGDYEYNNTYDALILYSNGFTNKKYNPDAIVSGNLKKAQDSNTMNVATVINQLIAGNDENDICNGFIPFLNIIPDGTTIDFAYKPGEETTGYNINPIRVINIEARLVHQYFYKTTTSISNSEKTNGKLAEDFYVDGQNKLRLRFNQTIFKNIYNKCTSNETEKWKMVITDNNGDLYIYPTISKYELDQLNSLKNYRIYNLDANYKNPTLQGRLNLQSIIGTPFYIGSDGGTANKDKYNEETYNNVYKTTSGHYQSKQPNGSSKWDSRYITLWSNIGVPEHGDGTYRGSIWGNIGTGSNRFIGDGDKRNTAKNQYPTTGLPHYDHNVVSGKAMGNVIDIWYNIGNPLSYAGIYNYNDDGTRGAKKNAIDMGNVVSTTDTKNYNSGYRYQSLWDAIGKKSQGAIYSGHKNLWEHIGNSYTPDSSLSKITSLTWPTDTKNPIPTVSESSNTTRALKKTVWSFIDYLIDNIRSINNGIKTACSRAKTYIDTQISTLNSKLSKINDDITSELSKIKNDITDKFSKSARHPRWGMSDYYMIGGQCMGLTGQIAGTNDESITLQIQTDGWLFCTGHGNDSGNNNGTGLLIEWLTTSGSHFSTIFDIVAYDYGHPQMFFPVKKGETYRISCPNNVKLKTVYFYGSY